MTMIGSKKRDVQLNVPTPDKGGKREREKGKEEMGLLRHPVVGLKVAGGVKKEMAIA